MRWPAGYQDNALASWLPNNALASWLLTKTMCWLAGYQTKRWLAGYQDNALASWLPNKALASWLPNNALASWLPNKALASWLPNNALASWFPNMTLTFSFSAGRTLFVCRGRELSSLRLCQGHRVRLKQVHLVDRPMFSTQYVTGGINKLKNFTVSYARQRS